MSDYEYWSLVWLAVQAVATAATFLVVLAAALLTVSAVREAARARRLQSAVTILDHISSDELRAARRYLHTSSSALNAKVSTDNPSWPELDRFISESSGETVDLASLHSYLAALENVAMLVMHDLAPDDLIEMYLGRMAVRHWNDARPFIDYMRMMYQSDDFLQHFEMMVALMEENGLRLEGALRPRFFRRLQLLATGGYGASKRRRIVERHAARRAHDETTRP